MGKKKLFTEEQEQYIIDNYQTMRNAEIAKNLGEEFTRAQVSGWLSNRKLRKGRKISNLFKPSDIEFMKANYDKMLYKDIGKAIGFTERQVRGWLNANGYKKRREINDHYFDEIDSPIKAYFLGFIFADGWICFNEERRNYELGIELQTGDKYILDRLNEELGGLNDVKYLPPENHEYNGKIIHGNGSYVLRVYSKNLILGLMANGIATNKTLKEIHPIVSDEYFFDFLRGYIDGDGCFWKYKNHYYMHITCATDKVLKHIQSRLAEHDIETRIYKETDRKYRLMCVNTAEMKKLCTALYPSKDVFCLTRKIERVSEYLDGSAA